MAEKTEQPTSKKRKDSAKKGQTFKSKDVITTVILLVGIYFLAHAVSFGPFISFYTHLLQYTTRPGMGVFLLDLARIFSRWLCPLLRSVPSSVLPPPCCKRDLP